MAFKAILYISRVSDRSNFEVIREDKVACLFKSQAYMLALNLASSMNINSNATIGFFQNELNAAKATEMIQNAIAVNTDLNTLDVAVAGYTSPTKGGGPDGGESQGVETETKVVYLDKFVKSRNTNVA